jgi:aspartate aminotransferase
MRSIDGVAAALVEFEGMTHSWLVGEPCFAPPVELVDGLIGAAGAKTYGYPPPSGLTDLREILAALHSDNGHHVEADQIVVTSGAKAGLLALLAALLEPGDELIHPTPYYPAYPFMASRLGARPVAVPEDGEGFAGWADSVASQIGPRTRAVVLASPSNPTGTTLGSRAAEDLFELCRDRGLRLICDEAYTDFRVALDSATLPADFDPERGTVIQIRSASKSWALCGWRIGWLVTDSALAANATRCHASLVNPASGPTQRALCALPEVPGTYLTAARASVEGRMRALSSALGQAGISHVKPEGGFYLWLNVGRQIAAAGAGDVVEWCVDLARRRGVGLWPGADFGSAEYVRIAVTSPSDANWQAAVEALVEALTSHGQDNS